MNLSIRNGRVIDPANRLDKIADLHLAEGEILALGPAPDGFQAEQVIDAGGQIVCPGLVDLSVRLREPGAEHKGTIASETRAAACNGITTVCCPPDTQPPIDTPAVAELLQQRARHAGMSRIVPLAALTQGLQGAQLAEMGDLREAGCVGVSNALEPVANTEVLRNAYAYAATHDLTVFVQAQDPWLGRAGCVHEGPVGLRLGLAGIPECAETIAVARELLLIELTGVRAHFCRLSSARALDMVRAARERGLPVSADVSAHQLFLSEQDIATYNSQCHVFPPLRGLADRDALRRGVKDGALDAICSDHQPHEADAKLAPFAMTAKGISGLDTLLPLVLRLAAEIDLPLADALAALTCKPARILGIAAGTLDPGARADVCVFDPQAEWRLEAGAMHSMGRNSPFLGRTFRGKVTHTVLGGRVVYRAA